MRDGESSSFPSATQPLNPNNPYSPDGKSLLTVETHLRTNVTERDGMCVMRLHPDRRLCKVYISVRMIL